MLHSASVCLRSKILAVIALKQRIEHLSTTIRDIIILVACTCVRLSTWKGAKHGKQTSGIRL